MKNRSADKLSDLMRELQQVLENIKKLQVEKEELEHKYSETERIRGQTDNELKTAKQHCEMEKDSNEQLNSQNKQLIDKLHEFDR